MCMFELARKMKKKTPEERRKVFDFLNDVTERIKNETPQEKEARKQWKSMMNEVRARRLKSDHPTT